MMRSFGRTMGGSADHAPRVFGAAGDLSLLPRDCPTRPLETQVLMADPSHFDVQYVINPFMQQHLGKICRSSAFEQWEGLTEVYRSLGFLVQVLDSVEGLPDLVFTANQSFPVIDSSGRTSIVRAQMHAVERRPEVEWVAEWFERQGVVIRSLEDSSVVFEGMGDCLWVPGHRFAIGGWGYRTQLRAYAVLGALLDLPIATLQLVEPRFYHLDTCLSVLDSRRALFVPEAFDATGQALLEALFEELHPVPLDEAIQCLACNGHSPDGRHFIVQRGAARTVALVQSLGLTPIEVDTTEFLKSGGSVYCMKLMVP